MTVLRSRLLGKILIIVSLLVFLALDGISAPLTPTPPLTASFLAPIISFLLKSVAPTTTAGPAVSATTATSTILSATIDEHGTGHYLTRLATQAAPTKEVVLAGQTLAMTANIAASCEITGISAATEYIIYFLARDTAGNTQEIIHEARFTTDSGIAPTTTAGPAVSEITVTAATMSVTIDENGTGFSLTQLATQAAPTREAVLAGNAMSMAADTPTTREIIGLVANTAYTIYFLARDAVGNTQEIIQEAHFTTDSGIAPTTSDLSITSATANGVTLSATINENGTGHYLTQLAIQAAPTREAVLAGSAMSMAVDTPTTREIIGLVANTAYTTFFLAEDAVGNIQAAMQEVDFTTDSKTPPITTTGPEISGITATSATVSATINENGTGHSLTQLATLEAPTKEAVLAGNAMSMAADTPTSREITGLTQNTDYKTFFLAKDDAGNTQESIQDVNFSTLGDTTPPTTSAGPVISGITTTSASMSTTINENGTGHYLVQAAADSPPAVTAVLAGNSIAMTANTPATAAISELTAATAYSLYFAAEDLSGNAQTTAQRVDFTTDSGIAPTTTGLSISDTTFNGATLSATIDENGTGYYLTRRASDPTPSQAAVLAGTAMSMTVDTPATAAISGLSPTTDYTIYFAAKDTLGNTQAAAGKVDFSTAGLPPNQKNILFAHGLNDDKSRWEAFNDHAESKGWTVYRTNVGRRDSIADRAEQLRNYILDPTTGGDALPPPIDGSLVVVGHSMGGLDLHYLISKGHEYPESDWGAAAAKIKRYYSIASPHKGNQFSNLEVLTIIAGLDGSDPDTLLESDAYHDLGITQMQEFNDEFPYSTFSINGRRIPALALRFSCYEPDGNNDDDGVVALDSQSFNGAPHTETILLGAHMDKEVAGVRVGICGTSPDPETDQTSAVLQPILDDTGIPAATHDIVFYEENNCGGGEKGVINSQTNAIYECRDNNINSLTHNDHCDEDEIRSVRLFPGVRKDLSIYVHDNNSESPLSYFDDWAVIHTGNQYLSEPICINTFEQQITTTSQYQGITMFYHQGPTIPPPDGNRLDGKISRIEISDTPRERILFYEGENCTQDVKGYFNTSGETGKPCTSYDGSGTCENDEIRSALLFPGVADNTIVKVYDSPEGSLSKDWFYLDRGETNLKIPLCVNGFEHSTSTQENEAGMTSYYRDDTVFNSNLNGSISYITITHEQDAKVVFYEGNNCSQQLKGYFHTDSNTSQQCDNYSGAGTCEDDEIRSAVIFPGVADDTIIKVYDSSSGTLSKDWFYLNRGHNNLKAPFCVTGFEHSTSTREAEAGMTTYYRDDNVINSNLNGSISFIKINTMQDSTLVFYEGDDCTQQVKGLYEAGEANDYFTECDEYSGEGTCQNDDIRSMLIQPGVREGKDIRVYDDPDGTLNDDYTSIYRGFQTLDGPFCINGFEHDTSTREEAAGISVNHHHNNGLNGRISYIQTS